MSLQEQAAQDILSVATANPMAPNTPTMIDGVISEYLDKGFYISVIAASLDDACDKASLEVSVICRAVILSRPEWDELIDEDSTPDGWNITAVKLASSIAGTGLSTMPLLEATRDLGDGGRIALAGALNPAFQGPPVSALAWHPHFAYPPISGLVMLNPSATIDEVNRAGQTFISRTEEPIWAVAPMQGSEALLPWPEWQALMTWVASEEPVGSFAYWHWLISHVDSGELSEVIGTPGSWKDTNWWEQVADERLGYLLDNHDEYPNTSPELMGELVKTIQASNWPAISHLRT